MNQVQDHTASRIVISRFLDRARRYHANIGGTGAFDVTDLMARLQEAKASGSPVGLVPVLIKATAMVLKRNPKLNRQLYQGLFRKYEVQFEEANCATVVRRQNPAGEDLLITVVLKQADQMDLQDIAKKIRFYQTAPLEEIPGYDRLARLYRHPNLLGRFFNFKARTDHKFMEKNIPATYGLSCIAGATRVAFMPTQTISPYCATFFPASVTDRAWVVNGQIQMRKILEINLTMDHYLVDGGDGLMGLDHLGEILSNPASLGL